MIQDEEENPIALIEMQDGGVIAGKKAGDSSNPFRSGRSYFQVNLFFRSQNFTLDLGDFDIKTVGIIFGLIRLNMEDTLTSQHNVAHRETSAPVVEVFTVQVSPILLSTAAA